MMRTPDKEIALLYFENGSVKPVLNGFNPNTQYSLLWFNPQEGQWEEPLTLMSDDNGSLKIPSFPDSQDITETDWALKIKRR
jgi:hypothetical protein